MIAIAIAVPRSGSTMMSASAAPTTTPIGRISSPSDCGAGSARGRRRARVRCASLASSDGWNVKAPSAIQRRAPLTGSADDEHGDEERRSCRAAAAPTANRRRRKSVRESRTSATSPTTA